MTDEMTIRLIALDLDGTLLDSSSHVPERNRNALREAAGVRGERGGVVIALASGRMTDCITPFAGELGLDCYIMAYNGAMIRGPEAEGRATIFHRPLQARYGAELIDYCRDRYMLNFYDDDKLYAQGAPGLRRYADIYANQTGAVYHFVDDLAGLAEKEPTKLILITDPPERDRLHDELAARWGEVTTIVKTNPEYLEFLNRDTDKGVALMMLGETLGLAREEIMALGDGDNDAPMLAAAGLGIAMANAGSLSKRSAKLVSELTNDEFAVAEAIERYVLARGRE